MSKKYIKIDQLNAAVFAAALVASGATGFAQTRIGLSRQAKDVDFTAAESTRPVKMGTELPSVCTIGEVFFKSNAESGKNLYGCTGTGIWNQLGATGSAVTSFQLTDCQVVAQGASVAIDTPCRVNIGGVVHAIASGAVATLSGVSATGTAYFYWNPQGQLIADENGVATLTCNGNCQTASTGGFPPGVLPIGTVSFADNVFGVITDMRSFFSHRPIYCGTGLTCLDNRMTGELTVSAETSTSLVTKNALQGGQLARCVSVATSAAHTCSFTPPLNGYAAGMVVEFVNSSTGISGASTLAINGLPARPIKRVDGTSDPIPSEVAGGVQVPLRYDGTVFRLPASGSSTVAGPFSSLPVCTATGVGSSYLFSDSLYSSALCSGTGWLYFRSGSTVTPPSGIWSWDNQTQTGSATLSASRGVHELRVPATHTTGYAVRHQAAPSAPFARTFLIQPDTIMNRTAPAGYLVGLRESLSGKLHGIGLVFNTTTSQWMLSVVRTTPTAGAGTDFEAPVSPSVALFLRVEDDATNIKFSYSHDGFQFQEVASVARSSYLTGGPGQLFFGAASAGSAPGSVMNIISIQ